MSQASTLEQQMLELINNERTSQGLEPVQLELRLNDASEDHSQWMLQQDVFSHTGENGSNPGDRMEQAQFEFSGNATWAENIAWQSERGALGLQDDVIDLHNSLMDSPGHRANILNPDVTVIGIGIETGDYQGYEAVMVTQNFARTSAPLQLDQGATPPTTPTEPPETTDNSTPPETPETTPPETPAVTPVIAPQPPEDTTRPEPDPTSEETPTTDPSTGPNIQDLFTCWEDEQFTFDWASTVSTDQNTSPWYSPADFAVFFQNARGPQDTAPTTPTEWVDTAAIDNMFICQPIQDATFEAFCF